MAIKLSVEDFSYLPTFIALADLPERAKAVWFELSRQTYLGDNQVCAATKALAQKLACSIRTVRRALRDLIDGKFIIPVAKNGLWRHPVYVVDLKRKPRKVRQKTLHSVTACPHNVKANPINSTHLNSDLRSDVFQDTWYQDRLKALQLKAQNQQLPSLVQQFIAYSAEISRLEQQVKSHIDHHALAYG